MSEEHLRMLEALGTLAREDQLEHRELEALCDPERRAEALQRAGSLDKALTLATQPLSTESQARIVQRVQEALRAPYEERLLKPSTALAGGSSPANQNTTEPEIRAAYPSSAEPTVRRKRPSARAQPRPVPSKPAPRPLRTWLSVTLPLLAAAAGVLLLLDPVQEPFTLPEYSLEAHGSSSFRGDPEEHAALSLPAGGTLELELRPESEYAGELELRVHLQRGADSIEVPARIEQSAHGSLRVRIDRAALPGSGSASLLVTLARPEALPLLAAREPNALHGEGWQAWQLEIALP